MTCPGNLFVLCSTLCLVPASAASQGLARPAAPGEASPDAPGDETPRARWIRSARRPPRVSLGLSLGTGLGWVHGGHTDNIHAPIADDGTGQTGPGWAHAPLHLAPELSYVLSHRWHLGLQTRVQLLNITSVELGFRSQVSVLALARARWFVSGERFRWFVTFGAGAGQIRHRIQVEDFWDTRAAGYLAANLGTGVTVRFNRYVGVSAELSTHVLFPDIALHGDLNTGLVLLL